MFDFPNSPALNQVVTGPNGASYRWDNTKWSANAQPPGQLNLSQGAGITLTPNPVVGTGAIAVTVPLVLNQNAAALPTGTFVLQLGAPNNVSTALQLNSFGTNPGINFAAAAGTAAAPTALLANATIGTLGAFGYTGSAYVSGSYIYWSAIENWTTSAQGTQIAFNTTTLGSTASAARMTIRSGVQIGNYTGDPGMGGLICNASSGIAQGPQSGRVRLAQFVGQDGASTDILFDTTSQYGGQITFRQSRGTAAAPTATQSGDNLGVVEWFGRGATGYAGASNPSVVSYAQALETFTDSAAGAGLYIATITKGTNTQVSRLAIQQGVYVGSGTVVDQGAGHLYVQYGLWAGQNLFVGGSGSLYWYDAGSSQMGLSGGTDLLLRYVKSQGYQCRSGTGGPAQSNMHNIDWNGGAHLWIDVTNQGAFQFTASDARLKQNITPASADALTILRAAKLYEFDWAPDELRPEPRHWRVGFLAQELIKTLPEAVDAPDSDLMGVDLRVVSAFTVRALQQLTDRLEALERKCVRS